MGYLCYNFAQRIDFVVRTHEKMKSLFEWDKPEETFGIAFLLSFMVICPKISISIFSLALLFGKQKIYKKMYSFQGKEDPSKRLLLP